MSQKLFFADDSETPDIPGLMYIPDYISTQQQVGVIRSIDTKDWSRVSQSENSRRVQHYGYNYSYERGVANKLTVAAPFLPWAKNLAAKIVRDKLMQVLPDQLIINEYEPGQGIAAHIDAEDLFNDTIVCVSMGSTCVMDFIHSETAEKIALLLQPKSAFVISGDARHKWKHGIAARKTDKIDGQTIQRSRRISLTFRNTLLK